MANSANPDENEIPWDLALKLLRKLSEDDTFRDAYKKDPAAAFRLLGFPSTIIDQLPPGPGTVGSKADFQAALEQVNNRLAQVYHCQIPPHMKFAASVAKPIRDPFAGP